MRLVLHDYPAHPFTLQLARTLAARGHEVTYLHGGGVRPSRADTGSRPSDPPTLAVEAVAVTEPMVSAAGLRRLRQERRYGRSLADRVVDLRPDVVLSVPSSLDAQDRLRRAAQRHGIGFVHWMQDVYGEAVARLIGRRFRPGGRLLAAPFTLIERRMARDADGVVAITEDFLPILHRGGVDGARVSVIPNWAPLIPAAERENPWSTRQGLDGATVLLYAGTLGRKHDPDLLVALADGIPEAEVVVVAEGVGVERLAEPEARRRNLRVLPLQPAGDVPGMLATADVLVALLEPDASVFSVPSKVLGYLVAGRPVLAAIPPNNLAARMLTEAGAGIVVAPGDRGALVAAARSLLVDNARRLAAGSAARDHAERAFAIEPIADRFEAVLSRAAHMAHSGAPQNTDTSDVP